MSLLLGIDTGGTYTDAVLFEQERGVAASAKALTTRHDLAIGIHGAMEAVLARRAAAEVELVSLSTTLATNAIVEGQGSAICLILIGYTHDMLDQVGLREVMGGDPVVFVSGGHDAAGEQVAPLDREAALQAVSKYAAHVSAFAVSGYFSVRNPEHENEVRQIIRRHSGLPVTCGHELSTNLHASRRALTAALNARLVPMLGELIRSVQGMMAQKGIRAPLMVVKGDGSLIDSRLALEYPIETILSGPAASVVGSLYLSGERTACIADMGGTTTDIALVSEGRLLLNRDGATVGGWQTMVEAVQIHTYGLGGDSEVRLEEREGLVLGPRRSVPLSLLAQEHPEVLADLKRQLEKKKPGRHDGRFLLPQRPSDAAKASLSSIQLAVLERVGAGPLALDAPIIGPESSFLADLELKRLIERGYLALCSFTPSDASHVLGYQCSWSAEAAQIGAQLMARAWDARKAPEDRGPSDDAGAEAFCRRVLRQVTLQSARAILSAALAETHGIRLEEHERLRKALVDPAIVEDGQGGSLVGVKLTLRRPLVAIGAPVATYFPAVSESLNTRLCVPPHAEVANAVGAVVGSVMQTVRALISPQEEGTLFRVHFQDGVHDFAELKEAAAFATRESSVLAEQLALRAGAGAVQVKVARRDHTVEASGEQIFLASEITATAAGRPRLAHELAG